MFGQIVLLLKEKQIKNEKQFNRKQHGDKSRIMIAFNYFIDFTL